MCRVGHLSLPFHTYTSLCANVLCLQFLYFQVLDGITRLGSLYVQICNVGCTLFQNWKAVFFCNPRNTVLTVVEFGKDGKHKVRHSV